ncbi:glutathione S-transferase family protein [Devosia sp.]|uniref:glutathione S-transferase family protein n=1 Tax=Devosia sp. TaxID=1871048 RepID=UPI003262F0B7
MSKLTLISFALCPFVQRAVIALKEKNVPFDVVYIDLANKPQWFLDISPLGKVPVLKVPRDRQEDAVVFESAVILEYLEETAPGVKLHPADPLERAQHRAWIEYGSAVLGDLYRFGSAKTATDLDGARQTLLQKFTRLEQTVVGPFFAGEKFSYVDAVFAPAFRQLDAVETVTDTGLLDAFPKVSDWRKALAARPSVKEAVPADFVDLYLLRLRGHEALVLKAAA